MARYIMANRRAGKFETTEKVSSRDAVASVMAGSFMANASIVNDHSPADETARQVVVFEAEPAEIRSKAQDLPSDVIIEPEILHYPRVYCPMDFLGMDPGTLAAPAAFGQIAILQVKVRGRNKPLPGAELILYLRASGGISRALNGLTDDAGVYEFQYSKTFSPSALIVVPAGEYWPLILRGPSNPVTVNCPPLPVAKGSLGWWHKFLGERKYEPLRGQGIRVGVADTGVGPHPNLSHVHDIGAFIDGAHDPDAGADVNSHGTHVSGAISARTSAASQYAGIAPGAVTICARVFPPNRGANQGDIVRAIDGLSRDHQVDLINLSLGAPQRSEIEHDAIVDALQRGTLCICAAANSNGPVEFPAAFPETVAVAAIGLLGWGEPGTLASIRAPLERERFGDNNCYHANFSCYGPEISCAAPGVGVISTVPGRFGLQAPYGAMDGTSMASPVVCGTLAVILSNHESYVTLDRNEVKSAEALRLLRVHCRTIGLHAKYEGYGMPFIA